MRVQFRYEKITTLRCVASILTVVALVGSAVKANALVDKNEATHELKRLRGRVVWLAEAQSRLHGIKTVPEAKEHVLALETANGELHPLVEDIRGRAFRRDERLRKIDVELLVRQHHGSPMVQVVQVFELTKDDKYEIDYWCTICSIAMFELKECDCCQGPIEYRRQPVGTTR